jgi:hypothetical protein
VFREKLPDTFITESNISISSVENGRLSGYSITNESQVIINTGGKKGRNIREKGKKNLTPISLGNQYKFKLRMIISFAYSEWKMKQGKE